MFSISDITEEEFGRDEEDEGEDDTPVSLPIRTSLSITKVCSSNTLIPLILMSPISQTTAPGALNVDMLCQDGTFSIENLSYYDDAKTGTELTADADWNRRGLYIGPQVEISIFKCHNCSSLFPSLIPLTLASRMRLISS